MSFLELLTSPLIKIMNCLSAPVVDRIGYIRDLRTNFDTLNEKARDLFIKRDDAKDEINKHGMRKRKMATRESENWLNKVEKIEHQLNEIIEEYNREDGQRLRPQYLNMQSQWNLGKTIFVTMNRISDLIIEFNSLKQAAVDALPQVVETMPAPKINVETDHTLYKILECVTNPEKHKIGIWGMGGVGKTTLMKYLNNLPQLKEIFEIVIWVTISKDYNIRKTQKEIADRCSVTLSGNESDERVASTLYEHLKTKKFLLLMDDVWEKVDLNDVGVTCTNQNGSKVVLTTRYKKVCNEMETDEVLKVDPLSSEEAWKLFHEKVGDVVDLPSIHPKARSVVAECAGLPLAIIVIGAYLRNEGNIYVWNKALKDLSSPTTSNNEDMEKKVFNILRISLDGLMDDNLRSCFLYAALFPEDCEIRKDEIIEFWMVEGFISSSLDLIETRDQGYDILKRLIDASLLEDCIDETMHFGETVKMHDVIRDLALKITSAEGEDCKFFVRAGTMMKQPPKNKEWEQVKRISLMRTGLRELPERPSCPNLFTLLLQSNRLLKPIPESFFETMHSLRVLDLSGTGIESLPPSICNLVSLRGLYLNFCILLQTLPPEIGALTSLEVLDADASFSCTLPYEIGNLSQLRVLKSASFGLMHAGGTLRRLSLLEQLITPWAGDTEAPIEDTLLEDICCLKKLKRLKFTFPEVKHLEYFLRKSSPWKEGSIMAFDFTVGNDFGGSFRDKNLTFMDGESIPNAIVRVLLYSNSFNLVRNRSIRKLCETVVGNMNGLRCCTIYDCDEMEIVLDGAQITDIALPNLETLNIDSLPNLKSICNDPLPLGSLACLKSLQVIGCDKLEKIFSLKTIQQLSNLEDLSVEDCRSLTEVIHEEAGGMMFDCNLPKLRHLHVAYLPSLVCILKGCCLSCPSLEEIEVYKCPKLKRLPQGIDKASNLQKIRCDKDGIWWDELEWDDNAIKLQLQLLVSREFEQFPP